MSGKRQVLAPGVELFPPYVWYGAKYIGVVAPTGGYQADGNPNARYTPSWLASSIRTRGMFCYRITVPSTVRAGLGPAKIRLECSAR